jgi:hypothetical protein
MFAACQCPPSGIVVRAATVLSEFVVLPANALGDIELPNPTVFPTVEDKPTIQCGEALCCFLALDIRKRIAVEDRCRPT